MIFLDTKLSMVSSLEISRLSMINADDDYGTEAILHHCGPQTSFSQLEFGKLPFTKGDTEVTINLVRPDQSLFLRVLLRFSDCFVISPFDKFWKFVIIQDLFLSLQMILK